MFKKGTKGNIYKREQKAFHILFEQTKLSGRESMQNESILEQVCSVVLPLLPCIPSGPLGPTSPLSPFSPPVPGAPLSPVGPGTP